MTGIRVRGRAAFLRALHAELVPVFGATPFTVELMRSPIETGRPAVLAKVEWAGWRYWCPIPVESLIDRTRPVRVAMIADAIERQELPRSRRQQLRTLPEGAS